MPDYNWAGTPPQNQQNQQNQQNSYPLPDLSSWTPPSWTTPSAASYTPAGWGAGSPTAQYTPTPLPSWTPPQLPQAPTGTQPTTSGVNVNVPETQPTPWTSFYSGLFGPLDKNDPVKRGAEVSLPIAQFMAGEYWKALEMKEQSDQFWATFRQTAEGNAISQALAVGNFELARAIAENQVALGKAEFDWNKVVDEWNKQIAWGQIEAQRYQAEQAAQAQLGAAGLYSEAQRYGAEQSAQAQVTAAQLGLQGTLGSAELYSGAQRYQAELQYKAAMAEDLTRRYGIDAETAWRMADREMNWRVAQLQADTQRDVATMQAYGRRQAPTVRWVRNW